MSMFIFIRPPGLKLLAETSLRLLRPDFRQSFPVVLKPCLAKQPSMRKRSKFRPPWPAFVRISMTYPFIASRQDPSSATPSQVISWQKGLPISLTLDRAEPSGTVVELRLSDSDDPPPPCSPPQPGWVS